MNLKNKYMMTNAVIKNLTFFSQIKVVQIHFCGDSNEYIITNANRELILLMITN